MLAALFAKVLKFNQNHDPKTGRFFHGASNASTEQSPSGADTGGLAGTNTGRDTGAAKAGVPKSYRRRLGQLRTVTIGGHQVQASEWNIKEADQAALNAKGIPTPTYLELKGPERTKAFAAAITAAKEANPAGASVYVYPDEDYAKMKLFTTEDGKAGVAVKPDGDIVSVFNTPGGIKGVAFSALHLAVQNGGRKLDAFDTVLPHIYAKAGFTAQSRLKWDDSQAPSNWDKSKFKDFNNGEPDVVFMTFDPTRGNKPYSKDEGKLVSDYGDAVSIQESKMVKKGGNQLPFAAVLKFNQNHDKDGKFAKGAENARSTESTDRPGAGSNQGAVSLRPQQADALPAQHVTHYSHAEGLTSLSAAKYGTGIKGAEARRLKYSNDPDIKNRVYFYLTPEDGSLPKKETGLGNHVYQVQLGNLYDFHKDPAGILTKIQDIRDNDDKANMLESLVVKAGYDGYVSKAYNMAIVLGKDVPVKQLLQKGWATVLKLNPYHDDNGRFTSKANAVHAGHKNKPTVSAMEEAMDKVGPEAFEAAVNEHLKGKGQLSPNRLASEIELVARQLIAKKMEYALVLKYNPYHGPDGKFTTHGNATFVSMRGKDYANVKTQGGKNTGAAETQLNKLGNLAHAFGKNWRAGEAGSAAFANNALDQMQLAANGAHTYGNNSQAYGEARQDLREKIAQAFAASGLPAAEKQGLGIPLTASEHAAIAAATLKQKAKEDKKAKDKLAKDFVNKHVETMLEAEKAQLKGDWATHDQKFAELQLMKDEIHKAGGSASEIYNLQDKAAKEMVKAKDKHAAKLVEMSEAALMESDFKKKAALQAKANKYWKEKAGYLTTAEAQGLVAKAKENIAAKKQAALEAHGKLNDDFYSGRVTMEQYDASVLAMTKLGVTADEKIQAEDNYQAAKAAKKLTGQAPVTAAGMADTLTKMGVSVPKDPKTEHAENIQAWLDAKEAAKNASGDGGAAADKVQQALMKYKASKQKLMNDGMSEMQAIDMITDVKNGKYKQATGNQLPQKDAKTLAEEKYMAAYKKWHEDIGGPNSQQIDDEYNAAKQALYDNHGYSLTTLKPLKEKVKSGEFNLDQAGNQFPPVEMPKVKMATTMANPLNKDEAMHLAKAMGKQYYDLKAAGAGQADLEAAHKLYDQAKDKYVEHGGKKDEFAAISSDLKSQATSYYNMIHKAKAQAKMAAMQAATADLEAYHAAVVLGHDQDTVNAAKAKMEKTLAQAEADGHLDSNQIAQGHISAKASANHMLNGIKDTHKKAVVAATIKLHSAELAGDGNGMNEHALPFAHAVKDAQKYFSKEELTSIKDEAKAEAAKQWEAIKAFKDAVGNPHKIMDAYDTLAGGGNVFKYPKQDKTLYDRFRDDQDAQIAQLTSSTRSVLVGYTGSEYKETNKAVGKYGTAIMNGETPPALSSAMKKRAEDMDAAFKQIKLGENLMLRRNMPQKYFWNQLGFSDSEMHDLSPETLKSMVGKVYKETAYGSSSMNPNFGSFFSNEPDKTGGMKLIIRAHKDINAVRVDSISSNQGEEEVILPRGTTYVIRSVKKVGNFKHGDKYSYEVEVDAIGMFPDKL